MTATASDVIKGKVIVGPDGEPITGTLELTGNASASDVVTGKTFYSTDPKTKLTGSMLTMAGGTYTAGSSTQTIQCSGKKMTSNIIINPSPVKYIDLSSSPLYIVFPNDRFTQNRIIRLPTTPSITRDDIAVVELEIDFGPDNIALTTYVSRLLSISNASAAYDINMGYFKTDGSDYITGVLTVRTGIYASGEAFIQFLNNNNWAGIVRRVDISASVAGYYIITT